MVTKKQQEQKAKEEERFTYWPIQIGLPGPQGENDERQIAQWVTVAVARTFNIARYMAYSIAMRGIPTAWPKSENQQNLPGRGGWLKSSVAKAQGLGPKLTDDVQSGAVQDRGILAAREMRGRGRLGPIIGELRQMSEEAENPQFRAMTRSAANALGMAIATPVMPVQETNYGIEWVRNHTELLDAAADAWGVDHIDLNACAVCGQNHHAPHAVEEINVEDLMEQLTEAFGNEDPAHEVQPNEHPVPVA